jgi:tetratricopeptide (TPR) repeat protein
MGAIHAQPQKMPIPVEDDTNAPTAMRQPAPGDTTPSPESGGLVSQAMALYKNGDYEKALDVIKGIDPATQDDNFVILKARILTELKQYNEGEKLLKERFAISKSRLVPDAQTHAADLLTALGDLYLHKRSFDRAGKTYEEALTLQPNDADLTLKLIYARIGSGDLPGARQLASTLVPFDPKHPYDNHATYDFAHAALAQAQGRAEEADEDIQTARTNYGITVTNHYLKTYLQFFSAPDKSADMTPPKKP